MNTVKIYNAGDNFEVDRIVALMKENDIECYIMESGTGGYLAIQQGFSIYGKDIYVLEENKEKAKELIDNYVKEVKEVILEENDSDEEYKVPWFKNRVIVARIIIVGGVIIGILSLVINNM